MAFKLPVKKKPAKQQQVDQAAARKAVQDWLPWKDIAGGVITRKDGQVVAVLKVEPFNLALKSENEKNRVIAAVHEALNGQREAFQILSLGRPVDLDAYLKILQDLAKEVSNPARKKLLQEYTRYVATLVASGEALERRYYILLPGKEQVEVLQRAHELASNLERSGLKVRVCSEQEIIDLVFVFTHPAQAAFERPPIPGPYLPSQVKGA
jgi:chemotaxis response regulator CheB